MKTKMENTYIDQTKNQLTIRENLLYNNPSENPFFQFYKLIDWQLFEKFVPTKEGACNCGSKGFWQNNTLLKSKGTITIHSSFSLLKQRILKILINQQLYGVPVPEIEKCYMEIPFINILISIRMSR